MPLELLPATVNLTVSGYPLSNINASYTLAWQSAYNRWHYGLKDTSVLGHPYWSVQVYPESSQYRASYQFGWGNNTQYIDLAMARSLAMPGAELMPASIVRSDGYTYTFDSVNFHYFGQNGTWAFPAPCASGYKHPSLVGSSTKPSTWLIIQAFYVRYADGNEYSTNYRKEWFDYGVTGSIS